MRVETPPPKKLKQKWYHLHPRQQSSQLILVPTFYAWWIGYPVGASIYGTNWAVSTLTHSANDAHYFRWHTLDLIAIGCWAVYNTVRVMEVLTIDRPSTLLVVALLCAALTGVLYAQMQYYTYESDMRQHMHLSMHATGVVGTLALLYVANKANSAPSKSSKTTAVS